MKSDATTSLRLSFYWLLSCLAIGMCIAKIVGAENVVEPSRYAPPSEASYGADHEAVPKRVWPKTRPEPMPTFSSNDKSRWATIKALVEKQTFVVGQRENWTSTDDYRDSGIIFQDGYQSLDKVMNPETGLFYSSKPPLFTCLAAAEYFVLYRFCGLTLDHDRWWVVCIIVATFNVLPFAVFLYLLSKLIEEHGTTDFGKFFTFTVAASATFMTTFSITLNNHTPAACCVLFALYPLLRSGASESLGDLFLSGFFAGLTATLELPAASLAVGLFVPLAIAKPSRAVLAFLPGALIPVAALFVTNFLAMDRWLPAYGEFGGPWYDFPGSHWAKLKLPGSKVGLGIDFAEERKTLYAFHLLVGHHGWFSLSPVWLLSLLGFGHAMIRAGSEIPLILSRKTTKAVWSYPLMLLLGLMVSVVVIGFYIYKTNNYGGFCSCARWFIWLTPLWLLALLPAADRIGRTQAGRVLAGVLLFASVFSVMYPAWNPWRPPWILQLCEMQGWVRY
jgi:hypothetical protein